MSMFGHTVRGLLEGVEAALSESVESLTIALNGVAASVGVLESEFASLEDSVHGVGGTVERIVDLEAGVGDTIERIVDLEAGVDSLEVSVNGPGGTVERISALESNGMTDFFSMDCTNVDSTIDNNLDISPHVSGHNFFHKCIEFKASAANYRSYYIGLLGDNSTNTNQFCIAGDGGGGGDPNAIAAFDDGGNVYMANDLFVDQKVECTSVSCSQATCTQVTCNQVTLPDGSQTNAFTSSLKSNLDNNTVKTTGISYSSGTTTISNNLSVNGDIDLSTVGKKIIFPDDTEQTTAFIAGHEEVINQFVYVPLSDTIDCKADFNIQTDQYLILSDGLPSQSRIVFPDATEQITAYIPDDEPLNWLCRISAEGVSQNVDKNLADESHGGYMTTIISGGRTKFKSTKTYALSIGVRLYDCGGFTKIKNIAIRVYEMVSPPTKDSSVDTLVLLFSGRHSEEYNGIHALNSLIDYRTSSKIIFASPSSDFDFSDCYCQCIGVINANGLNSSTTYSYSVDATIWEL